MVTNRVDLPVCETFIVAIRTTACVSICVNREFQYLQLSTGFSVIFARYKQYVWYGSPASLFHFHLFFLCYQRPLWSFRMKSCLEPLESQLTEFDWKWWLWECVFGNAEAYESCC